MDEIQKARVALLGVRFLDRPRGGGGSCTLGAMTVVAAATSMPEMAKAVAAIQEANRTRNLNVKVMVGGPPVNQDFADEIGADGYGTDAPAAVEEARSFVQAGA